MKEARSSELNLDAARRAEVRELIKRAAGPAEFRLDELPKPVLNALAGGLLGLGGGSLLGALAGDIGFWSLLGTILGAGGGGLYSAVGSMGGEGEPTTREEAIAQLRRQMGLPATTLGAIMPYGAGAAGGAYLARKMFNIARRLEYMGQRTVRALLAARRGNTRAAEVILGNVRAARTEVENMIRQLRAAPNAADLRDQINELSQIRRTLRNIESRVSPDNIRNIDEGLILQTARELENTGRSLRRFRIGRVLVGPDPSQLRGFRLPRNMPPGMGASRYRSRAINVLNDLLQGRITQADAADQLRSLAAEVRQLARNAPGAHRQPLEQLAGLIEQQVQRIGQGEIRLDPHLHRARRAISRTLNPGGLLSDVYINPESRTGRIGAFIERIPGLGGIRRRLRMTMPEIPLSVLERDYPTMAVGEATPRFLRGLGRMGRMGARGLGLALAALAAYALLRGGQAAYQYMRGGVPGLTRDQIESYIDARRALDRF